MNAPLHHHRIEAPLAGQLQVFAFFHLNLAFSSIAEERRGDVIERCYWPLLRLAERLAPIGVEVSGFTLEEIARRDPAWIARARALIGEGRIELIGSGYSQMIGPLVPGRVTAENLKIGNDIYRRLLGRVPSAALVNEQAFSAGLVEHYLDAGIGALLMDWDNPSAHHPEWDRQYQYLPQYAHGADGRKIAVLWTNTAAFQQLQRRTYDDITLDSYLGFVRGRRGAGTRALCLYASDAEIFDFRPGRFRTEEKLVDGAVEWARLEEALAAVIAEPDVTLTAPSGVLALMEREGAGNLLELGSAACPVPVKKQRKYNLARWAVTGRDNTAVNAACQRIYEGMSAGTAGPEDWKELCYLWASDFRTHITQSRWEGFCARLQAAEQRWAAPLSETPPVLVGEPVSVRHLDIETPSLRARLDRRRGLAITSLAFGGVPLVGSLPHGYFDEIGLQADWYTGDCVFEAPGEHKVTDLEWCEGRLETLPGGDVIAEARTPTPNGVIAKRMRFHAAARRVDFDISFEWAQWKPGSLRLGHITLLPVAFDLERLTLATCNGGGREEYPLAGQVVDHGAPVSFLVSSSYGLGMTEGWAEIGDARTGLRIMVDRACAPLLGMLVHRPARRHGDGESLFCQLQLSAMELDDTRKPASYRDGWRRFRFSLSECGGSR